MSKQPKALRLAEALSARVISRWIHSTKQTPRQSGYAADAECVQAAAELRRLHAECEALRAALQGIVDFADAPVECKRPDVFALRINKSRAALKEVSDADA